MKNNNGITMITLIITIIVVILIASITLYTGFNTLESVRKKNATDAMNAIYLALIANEENIPSGNGDELSIADYSEITNRQLTNDDYYLLGLDYTTDDFTASFDRTLSNNIVEYNIHYVDSRNKSYDSTYHYYKEVVKANNKAEFNTSKKVNRPVLNVDAMVPLNFNNEVVRNAYTENWYQYEKSFSKLAIMRYNNITYAWIPRFAYRIQDFYVGKSYDVIPATAIDIVFLRDNTNTMSNGEPLTSGFTVHPAFENGETGFWIMTKPSTSNASEIDDAIELSSVTVDGAENIAGRLMKNSEYAATIFLLKYLGNYEITFAPREFVAAVFNDSKDNFDSYSLNSSDANYYLKVRGHALSDTPWNIKSDLTTPTESKKYLVRYPAEEGEYYYEPVESATNAVYRTVIPE